jgi:glycine cleavage system aminomethyltransferase T
VVGHTLRSAYSPALKRAIALATIDAAAVGAGGTFSLTLPGTVAHPELRRVSARIVRLPFLPAPASIET